MSHTVTVQKSKKFLLSTEPSVFFSTMLQAIPCGRGVIVESAVQSKAGYVIRLRQEQDDEEDCLVLNEDELMKVVEQVCLERPNFARGVSRIYFRQQKAKRRAVA